MQYVNQPEYEQCKKKWQQQHKIPLGGFIRDCNEPIFFLEQTLILNMHIVNWPICNVLLYDCSEMVLVACLSWGHGAYLSKFTIENQSTLDMVTALTLVPSDSIQLQSFTLLSVKLAWKPSSVPAVGCPKNCWRFVESFGSCPGWRIVDSPSTVVWKSTIRSLTPVQDHVIVFQIA